MMHYAWYFLIGLVFNTLLYYYLHNKTHIHKKYIFFDGILSNLLTTLIFFYLGSLIPGLLIIKMAIFLAVLLWMDFLFAMLRFWRTPIRKVVAKPGELVSPADGKVIYIREYDASNPQAIKNERISNLNELTDIHFGKERSVQVGINMTPFDVHKNCAPIAGEITLSYHHNGKFLSLKNDKAFHENERHTTVLKNGEENFAIVQIASRLVRRIDSYIVEGQALEQGQWFGMIRFGSQVDLVMPAAYKVNVDIGQQVYARKTIIATKQP
jgi:phosphatidylserine decarboxylase